MGPMSQRGRAVSSGTLHRTTWTSCVMLDLSDCPVGWNSSRALRSTELCAPMEAEQVIKPAVPEPAVEKGHRGPREEKLFKTASNIKSPELCSSPPSYQSRICHVFQKLLPFRSMGNKLPAGRQRSWSCQSPFSVSPKEQNVNQCTPFSPSTVISHA